MGYAAASAAYLGRMYLRGEGVRADPAMARMWFERGYEGGDRECINALGVIWRDGLVGGRTDEKKAFTYFSVAAGQELAEAQVNLGKYYYSKLPPSLRLDFLNGVLQSVVILDSQLPISRQPCAKALPSKPTTTLP